MEKSSKLTKTVSCGCCVYRANQLTFEVLLVRPFPDRDAWGIPKGHIDPGESHVECAVRETIEETGILPHIIAPLPMVSTRYKDELKHVYSFLASPNDPKQTPMAMDPNENVDVRYFAIDQLPRLHRYQVALLDAAVNLIRTRAKQ